MEIYGEHIILSRITNDDLILYAGLNAIEIYGSLKNLYRPTNKFEVTFWRKLGRETKQQAMIL